MAKFQTATVKRGKGKMSNRHCVIVDTGKRAKGFKGKGSTKRMYGCFIELRAAKARASKLANSVRLGR